MEDIELKNARDFIQSQPEDGHPARSYLIHALKVVDSLQNQLNSSILLGQAAACLQPKQFTLEELNEWYDSVPLSQEEVDGLLTGENLKDIISWYVLQKFAHEIGLIK